MVQRCMLSFDSMDWEKLTRKQNSKNKAVHDRRKTWTVPDTRGVPRKWQLQLVAIGDWLVFCVFLKNNSCRLTGSHHLLFHKQWHLGRFSTRSVIKALVLAETSDVFIQPGSTEDIHAPVNKTENLIRMSQIPDE